MAKKTQSRQRAWALTACIWGGLLALILIGLSVAGRGGQERGYDFTKADVIKEWTLTGSAKSSSSPEGLFIANGPFRLMSPAPGSPAYIGPAVTWTEFPYIRIRLAKSPRERLLTFRWNPENSLPKSYGFPLRIPPNTDSFIFNTHALKFANARFSGRGYPIVQFGFEAIDESQVASGDYQIVSVSLVSSLSAGESWQLVKNSFFEPETFYASAVNFLSGFYIFERPVVFYFGMALVCGALLVAFPRTNRSAMAALVGAALAFQFILDMQFNVSLWSHVQYSKARSAWHESKHDEYAARFGQDFGGLATAFEEQVPRGSKVYFPQETLHTVWGEANWIAFQYYPAYQSVPLDEADYIFHYYPAEYGFEARDARHGVLRSNVAGRPKNFDIEILYAVGKNAKLLRVIRG
jgi:hypothetical protein